MKKIAILLTLLFATVMTTNVHAQSDRIYDVVEEMPEFPGGTSAMRKFLSENSNNPARERTRVILSFVVEKNGSLSDIKIIHSSDDPAVDQEAIRLVKKMPKWKPGKMEGK
ncbi:MAG: TonB family protein, partial [Prevotella sp.]|nr:TonB family protein [Prevotella sp.]